MLMHQGSWRRWKPLPSHQPRNMVLLPLTVVKRGTRYLGSQTQESTCQLRLVIPAGCVASTSAHQLYKRLCTKGQGEPAPQLGPQRGMSRCCTEQMGYGSLCVGFLTNPKALIPNGEWLGAGLHMDWVSAASHPSGRKRSRAHACCSPLIKVSNTPTCPSLLLFYGKNENEETEAERVLAQERPVQRCDSRQAGSSVLCS